MRSSISLFSLSLLLSSFLYLASSCKHDVVIPTTASSVDTSIAATSTTGWKCSADTVYFQYDALPILVSSCAISGCHDASSRADGYQLTDYANTIKKGVSAGKATSSKIYNEIASGSMPPRNSNVTMTTAQKDIIAKWINQGALNLNCNPNYGTCDTVNMKYAANIAPIIQNKCQGCHSSTAPILKDYVGVKASVTSGKFWGSISHAAGYSAMPKGSNQLPTCELNKINAWIKRGALNN